MSKPLVWQVVTGARVLIAKRATWTRYTLALTGNNRECDPTHPKAVRFCAFGALLRSAYDLTGEPGQAQALAEKAAMAITGRNSPNEAFEEIFTLNDGPAVSSRKAVLGLFDKSLEAV